MPRISVAMCTFNGANFVEAQLASIAAQTRPPNEIVICDDRSDDNTISIVREFANNTDIAIRIEQNEPRLGTIRNFDKTISLCTGDIIFLSDQDDVWRPEKMARMMGLIGDIQERHGKSVPILVHSDLEVVGPALEPIDPSFMRYQHIAEDEDGIGTLLVQNTVTGCASAFNRRLIELALPVPEDCIMHDWWLALVASTQGRIGYTSEALVRYRQHGKNAVGAKQHTIQPLWRAFQTISPEKRAVGRMLLRQTVRQADSLRQRLVAQESGNPRGLATVSAYAGILDTSRLMRPWIILRHGIRRQKRIGSLLRTVARQILFMYWVMRL